MKLTSSRNKDNVKTNLFRTTRFFFSLSFKTIRYCVQMRFSSYLQLGNLYMFQSVLLHCILIGQKIFWVIYQIIENIGLHMQVWYTCSHSIRTLLLSRVASPICQEGQSERTFPIFALSSQFFLFFPQFFLIFSPLFPNFCKFFPCQGWHSAPLCPPVAMPLLLLTDILRNIFYFQVPVNNLDM